MKTFDVVIVGGGQAGLSLGYYLKRTAHSFLILDKESEVGDVWKKRYDSLTLFTPNFYSELPGLHFTETKNLYPTKDEVVEYFQEYVRKHEIPIQHHTEILK